MQSSVGISLGRLGVLLRGMRPAYSLVFVCVCIHTISQSYRQYACIDVSLSLYIYIYMYVYIYIYMYGEIDIHIYIYIYIYIYRERERYTRTYTCHTCMYACRARQKHEGELFAHENSALKLRARSHPHWPRRNGYWAQRVPDWLFLLPAVLGCAYIVKFLKVCVPGWLGTHQAQGLRANP